MTVTATLELSYKATITPEKTNKRQEKTNKVSRSFQIIIIKCKTTDKIIEYVTLFYKVFVVDT